MRKCKINRQLKRFDIFFVDEFLKNIYMTTKGNATQILRSASPPLQIRFKSASSPFLRMGEMGFT